VYGTADGIGSVDAWGRFAGQLPNGRLLVIDGGRHLPWLDDPERIGSAIRSFLGEAA
jgi:pimeloyl-ACP methyl ester carboxylesterase